MTSRPKVSGLGLDTGQEGVWGIDYTAIQAKTFATNSRLLYVQPNNVLATDLGNTGEDPLTPFATVTAALARCRPYRGDTVLVGPNDAWQHGGQTAGTLDDRTTAISETVTVSVPGVAIIGAHTSPVGVVWDAPSANAACLVINALDVLIQGFAFQPHTGGTCITSEWDGADLWGDNVTIRSCHFAATVVAWDRAIDFEFCYNWDIYNCVFDMCDEYGVYQDPTGSGTRYLRIHDNFFNDIGITALLLGDAEYCEVYRNTFWNGNAVAGLAAPDCFIATQNGGRNNVHHNTMSCLLPGPGNGDFNDCNSQGVAATDSWNQNYCLDGPSVTQP